MLDGELALQAGMKNPKIRAADWDYSTQKQAAASQHGNWAPVTILSTKGYPEMVKTNLTVRNSQNVSDHSFQEGFQT
jgi:hypothetical protein